MAATPRQNAMIALLTLAAIVMAVLLVVLPAHPPTAQAGVTASAGGFTMATSTSGVGGDDAVAVVDQRSQRMVIYMLQNDRLGVVGAVDLAAGFNPAAPAGAAQRH